MLILSRNINQVVVIDDDIRVVVLGVQGNQVKLGFEADKSVAIDRSEVYEAKRRSEAKGND